MARTVKTKATARYGARYGARVKSKVQATEVKQRKKQKCPYCKKLTAKRLSVGIWYCKACKKKYALGAYYLEK